MKQYEILVRGRVQGVYYRGATQEQARKLGLTGWVQNEPDGSVRLVACGPEEALAQLLAWCRLGPPAAQVTEVLAEAQPPAEFHDFIIIR